MSNACKNLHRQGEMVLVLDIFENDEYVFREDQDVHVGQVLKLCKDVDVTNALDSDSAFGQCRIISWRCQRAMRHKFS